MKYSEQSVLAMMLLSVTGCQKAVDIFTAPPIVQAGYATVGTDLATENVVHSGTTEAIGIVSGAADTFTTSIDFTFMPTEDPDVVVATINGQSYDLVWDPSQLAYVGVAAGKRVAVSPTYISTDLQVMEALFAYGALDSSFAYVGSTVFGFKTNPTEVSALSGTAIYSGSASMNMMRDDGAFAIGGGTSTLQANFSTGMVSGQLDLADLGVSNVILFPTTTVTINPTPIISGNEFDMDMAFNVTDFGFTSAPLYSGNGYFYGVDASAIGGAFDGTAPTAGGGVVFQGTFAGD